MLLSIQTAAASFTQKVTAQGRRVVNNLFKTPTPQPVQMTTGRGLPPVRRKIDLETVLTALALTASAFFAIAALITFTTGIAIITSNPIIPLFISVVILFCALAPMQGRPFDITDLILLDLLLC